MIQGARKLKQSFFKSIYKDNYPKLIKANAIQRPNYAYIVYQAADLARRLGMPAISVLEFGVAGGRGLLSFEAHAAAVSAITGVKIEVYGFDTGEGLPPPLDYRDLPYIWQANQFKMDQEGLKKKLKSAKLVLGLVEDTVSTFVENFNPAPVGAISFDLDYYSSSVAAFKIFNIDQAKRLPRIYTYLDDIYSSDLGHVGPAVGVPLALSEFNAANPTMNIAALTHLEFHYRPAQAWHRQIYTCGDFTHPRFNDYIIGTDRQLPL